MKQPQSNRCWFFVDESGDPTFYDRHGNYIVGTQGCSKILILGFIKTHDPEGLRNTVVALHKNIINNPQYQHIASLSKTKIALHAKDDHALIRNDVFRELARIDFKAQFIVARKIERVFRNNFHARESEFYNHLVTQLFSRVLHQFKNNHICFAHRGSRARQKPLSVAIHHAVVEFEQRHKTAITTTHSIETQTPSGEPCLSVVDYMNWAVQRAFLQQDMQYIEQMRNQISLIVDLYEPDSTKDRYYERKNMFEATKITPL